MMHLSTSFSTALVLLSLGLRASAHGYPLRVTVDGTEYPGANGPSASGNSPVRKVGSNNPVTDPNSNSIICGLDARQASTSAAANPGSTLQFFWGTISGGNWFHNVGPILTYMAECPGDCSSFTPDGSTQWFKIDEQGQSVAGNSGTWAQADLLNGSPATVTIPNNLKSGNYLVRNELVSLQNSVSRGGAEYYPSCLQVTISGDASGVPDTTVRFPGAYGESDPGILGDFYTSGYTYVFPGGVVATISGSGSSSGNSGSSPSPDPQPSPAPSSEQAPSDPSTKASPPAASPSDAPTSLPGVVNPGASPSPATTESAEAAKPTATKKCRPRKSKLRRHAATTNDTVLNTSHRFTRLHRRRSPHAITF